MKKKILAVISLCLLMCMLGGCHLPGLGYTASDSSGCYLFGRQVYTNPKYVAYMEECRMYIRDNRDSLDELAALLMEPGCDVHLFRCKGEITLTCDDPDAKDALLNDSRLTSILDTIPDSSDVTSFSISASDDSGYDGSISFHNYGAYVFAANYIVTPSKLRYAGENIIGDWYLSVYPLE